MKYVSGKKTYQGFPNSTAAYKSDLAKFGNKYIDVPNKVIADYYNTKKCSYINVGSHGLFLLNKDALKLNADLKKLRLPSIPDFSDVGSAKTQIRVRVQYKGGGDYQFAFTLQFKSVSKSPYNLAPLKVGSTYLVDKKKLKSDPILRIF